MHRAPRRARPTGRSSARPAPARRASLADPTSALLVSGERSLAAEFPAQLQAQAVLEAIGTGERTWKGIQEKLTAGEGHLAASSLAKSLRLLEDKRVIAAETPTSAKPSHSDRRYRVADPYLRFYLAFLKAGLPLIERGRGDLVMLAIDRSWTAWRGRAVEPVVRDALLRLAPGLGYPLVEALGGWWNRRNNPEIDLVGVGREDAGKRVLFAGRIKWHEERSFDRRDYAKLARDITVVPGADDSTDLLAVSRSGTTDDLPIHCVSPGDLLAAWRADAAEAV
jgi:uncharacterized protein